MVLCAVLTALISQNGAVAALLPVVVMTAVRADVPASHLLIPLAFGSHAGTMLALTGTPVNFIVSDAASKAGAGGFGFFEFALAGLPRLVGTVAIVVLLGPRLLPDRTPATLPADLGDHARTLAVEHGLDHVVIGQILERGLGVAEVVVPPRSTLVAHSTTEAPIATTSAGTRFETKSTTTPPSTANTIATSDTRRSVGAPRGRRRTGVRRDRSRPPSPSPTPTPRPPRGARGCRARTG